jgi:UDP-N-acetylglucosamine--N-acetylmuramyl-(pentapeptide) pyrophosphoryl-undecaprenol N-acetylglucosamine transferase
VTVLLTGGSQGSRTLNRAAQESWPLWGSTSVRLIHQTGPRAYEDLAREFRQSGIEGEIAAFLPDMPAAFAAADIVVGRAGMSTVSELAAAGKPSILVPLPTAADQHQLRNAQAMERIGAARMVLDADFNGQRFMEEVVRLSQSPDRLHAMGEAARGFSKPEATRRAAEVLEEFV